MHYSYDLIDFDDQPLLVSADEAFAFLGIDRITAYRANHEEHVRWPRHPHRPDAPSI